METRNSQVKGQSCLDLKARRILLVEFGFFCFQGGEEDGCNEDCQWTSDVNRMWNSGMYGFDPSHYIF